MNLLEYLQIVNHIIQADLYKVGKAILYPFGYVLGNREEVPNDLTQVSVYARDPLVIDEGTKIVKTINSEEDLRFRALLTNYAVDTRKITEVKVVEETNHIKIFINNPSVLLDMGSYTLDNSFKPSLFLLLYPEIQKKLSKGLLEFITKAKDFDKASSLIRETKVNKVMENFATKLEKENLVRLITNISGVNREEAELTNKINERYQRINSLENQLHELRMEIYNAIQNKDNVAEDLEMLSKQDTLKIQAFSEVSYTIEVTDLMNQVNTEELEIIYEDSTHLGSEIIRKLYVEGLGAFRSKTIYIIEPNERSYMYAIRLMESENPHLGEYNCFNSYRVNAYKHARARDLVSVVTQLRAANSNYNPADGMVRETFDNKVKQWYETEDDKERIYLYEEDKYVTVKHFYDKYVVQNES